VAQQTDGDGRCETVEDALVRGLIEHEVRVPQADEALLRRFYDNNRHRFMSPPLYEADHILIAARREDTESFAVACETASALRSILATSPGRFATLARDWSDCPSSSNGGSLGQIEPGETTPEFEAALAGLSPGEISAPVETRYGIHLIRRVRRIDSSHLPFEAVRTRIAAYLVDHVRRQAMAQYVAILVGRSEISGIEIGGASSPLVQ
jgi:peptidyl-prolyl cis-trans isomerase C